MQNFKKLLFLLTPQEIRNGCLLLVMILIMAFLEMIGVASILPFIAVLTNPSLIETNSILKETFQLSKIYGVKDSQHFLFVLGVIVFLLLVFSLFFKALTTYMQLRYIQMREYSISKRLVEKYLHQPYSWFLGRHSADLGKTILSEVSTIVGGFLKPLLNIITKGMVVLALITLLILTDPKLAIIMGFTLSLIYGVIILLVRRYLSRLGKERLIKNQLRYEAVSEAFGAAKEIKTGGLEQAYIERFSEPARIFAQNITSARILSQLPHFILEAIAFGGVMLMILYLMLQKGSFINALPVISLYVYAGYRLMPGLHGIYVSIVSFVFVGPSLEKLYLDMKNLDPINYSQDQSVLSINKCITLKNLHYNYPNASRTSLKDVNINIPAKSTIGLIGSTGSGKTTMIDIILGLLKPQKGFLKVDEKIITQENVRSWQKSIGYVPQNIYLSDDTVSANIALGLKPEEISQEAVEKAGKIANLHEFVINELPKQYQTEIGERGVRLSGGQRQRIGIARALYHNPKVLILDEATSALDNYTEKVVMDAVDKLSKEITIILIAHRLNTVKRCDKIYLLEKGKIKNHGTFEELIKIDEKSNLYTMNDSHVKKND